MTLQLHADGTTAAIEEGDGALVLVMRSPLSGAPRAEGYAVQRVAMDAEGAAKLAGVLAEAARRLSHAAPPPVWTRELADGRWLAVRINREGVGFFLVGTRPHAGAEIAADPECWAAITPGFLPVFAQLGGLTPEDFRLETPDGR